MKEYSLKHRARRYINTKLGRIRDVPPLDPAPAHPVTRLPALPKDRRPLTAQSPNPQLMSPFFKLPPELRQQIYRILFSGREIHLDMRYTAVDTSTPHSTAGAVLHDSTRWQWRASSCHRHPDINAVADRCGWGGPPPTRCDMFDTPCGIGKGTMEFMLSCRLAYREGVVALYGDNTFHIGTGALIMHGRRLIVPARLETVMSLIFHVRTETIEQYATEHLGLPRGWNAYNLLIGMLPFTFPSLRRLEIVVAGMWTTFGNPSGEVLYPVQDQPVGKMAFFQPVDSIVLRYGQQLKECILVYQSYIFEEFLLDEERLLSSPESGGALAAGQRTECGKDWVQYWRRCDAGTDRATSTQAPGYWIRKVPNVWQSLNLLSDTASLVEMEQ